MFNITSKCLSSFNNKPSASWVAHITRDFLTCYSCSYYSSVIRPSKHSEHNINIVIWKHLFVIMYGLLMTDVFLNINLLNNQWNNHHTVFLHTSLMSKNQCVKSVQIRSFFWSVFSCIWTEYSWNLRIQSEYRKTRTRKNSIFGRFSRSEWNTISEELDSKNKKTFTIQYIYLISNPEHLKLTTK